MALPSRLGGRHRDTDECTSGLVESILSVLRRAMRRVQRVETGELVDWYLKAWQRWKAVARQVTGHPVVAHGTVGIDRVARPRLGP
jgi:hypothetical protein